MKKIVLVVTMVLVWCLVPLFANGTSEAPAGEPAATTETTAAPAAEAPASEGATTVRGPHEGPVRLGVAFQDLDNLYFVVMKEAVEDACEIIGAEVTFTDAHHDINKQINDIEDMVQNGIDILLINPTDSVGVQGAVETAKRAGVVVVAVDAQANGPIDSFVGSKNYDAGFLAGDYLAKYLNESGQVAILDGIPVVPILQRVEGFTAAMEQYPNIEIIDKQNGRQERSYALDVTENMIQANPDLDGIFSVNDTGSMGALAAITSSGKDIALVSVDGNPEAVKAILEGGPFKATSAQFPRDQVRIALGIALAKYWGANVPATVPIDVMLLDASNSADFAW